MAIPGNLSQRTVVGTYVDFEGNPIAGQIRFTLPFTLTDAGAGTFIVKSAETVTLDGTGSFSIEVPVTNDVDVTPTNYLYTVDELFPNGRTFTISLPAGSTVNIATLAPTDTFTQYYSLANSFLWDIVVDRLSAQEPNYSAQGYLPIPPGYTGTSPINLAVMNSIQATVKTHYTNVAAQATAASGSLSSAQASLATVKSFVSQFLLIGA